MAKRRSTAATWRRMEAVPERFLERVLPGAARAGATVIAEEAKDRLGGRRAEAAGGVKVLIADSVKVSVRRKGTTIRARVHLKGPGAYVGTFLEYGTAPHIISVDDSARGGKSVRRINDQVREGSLRIGANFVGVAVFHPGAKPHPFMAVSLDVRRDDAIAAAQGYIVSGRSGRGRGDGATE